MQQEYLKLNPPGDEAGEVEDLPGGSGGNPEVTDEEMVVDEENKVSDISPTHVTLRKTRLPYLQGLAMDETYQALCRKLKGSLRFDDIDGLPAWASWSFSQDFLPESFYSNEGLELAITDIGAVVTSTRTVTPTLVLAFGLVLRELDLAKALVSTSKPERAPHWVNGDFISPDSVARVVRIIGQLL